MVISIKQTYKKRHKAAFLHAFVPLSCYLKDLPSSVRHCFPEYRQIQVLLPESFCTFPFGAAWAFSPRIVCRYYCLIVWIISHFCRFVNMFFKKIAIFCYANLYISVQTALQSEITRFVKINCSPNLQVAQNKSAKILLFIFIIY